jgi:hypothetical protein
VLKSIALCSLFLTMGLPAFASGEDFAFAQPRPLMALCAELQEKYGLLITYEDAPYDADREVDSAIIPRNGIKALTPKWKPITFHVPSDLPTLAERTSSQAAGTAPVLGEALAAVQTLVNQYNESGNPGHFSVIQDRQELRIQQTTRMVSGKLEPFEPISETLLPWQSKSENCYQVLDDLSAALMQARGFGMAKGLVPSSLMMHHCEVEGNLLTVRAILEMVIAEFDRDLATGKKTPSSSDACAWELVYDPNRNNYFLSLILVQVTNPSANIETPERSTTASKVKHVQGPNRIEPLLFLSRRTESNDNCRRTQYRALFQPACFR